MPDSVVKWRPVENLRGLRDALLNLRPEYLTTLAEVLDANGMTLLEDFGLRYLQGDMPAWFYSVFLSSQAVALYKTEEKTAVRPIGVRHMLVRVLHREVIKQNKAEIISYLEPEQLAMSTAGCHKVLFVVRTPLEEKPDFVCIKLDIANAQNCISRSKCVEVLEQIPELRHLAWHAAVVLAPHTDCTVVGKFGEKGRRVRRKEIQRQPPSIASPGINL